MIIYKNFFVHIPHVFKKVLIHKTEHCSVKVSDQPCYAGDPGSIPSASWGISLGKGKDVGQCSNKSWRNSVEAPTLPFDNGRGLCMTTSGTLCRST